MAGLERRMIEVDGAVLEVFVGGAGAPAVCQSHPCSAQPPTGSPTDELGRFFRLIRVNPRGVGGSSAGRGPGDLTFRQHVEDLEAVRRQLGLQTWVYFGHSAGACIGLLYALQIPQALSGLVLDRPIGVGGRRLGADERSVLSPRHPEYWGAVRTAEPLHRHGPLLYRREQPSAEWLHLRPGLWVLTAAGAPVVAMPGEDERDKAAFEEFVWAFDVEGRLGQIRVATLVVASGQDPIVPLVEGELLHAGLPHARWLLLEETGHDGPDAGTSDYARWNAALERFISGCR